MLTLFGVAALTLMMLTYALEARGRAFTLAFAAGCVLASAYGFLAGTWPFGIVEALWALVAANRFFAKPDFSRPADRSRRRAETRALHLDVQQLERRRQLGHGVAQDQAEDDQRSRVGLERTDELCFACLRDDFRS